MARRTPPTIDIDGLNKKLGELEKSDWQTYQCTLVTPMYGGGVKPGVVDKEMPIRASAIRGQLRFWWRVVFGRGLMHNEMFERETAIWGGIGDKSAASKVEVRVVLSEVKSDFVSSTSHPYGKSVSYGFGAAANNGEAQWLKEGFGFSLHIRYPENMDTEIKTCLRWWMTFGGLGARTRRGFGAVRCNSISTLAVEEIKRADCQILYVAKNENNAIEAWKTATGRLMKFRQGAGFARTDSSPRPGRSFWPEPDQLRRDTGKNDDRKHMPEHQSGNTFPRAAFGMPIIFDFHKTSEPDKKLTELLPRDGERMASPLILCPTKVDGKWCATALLLPTWKAALAMPLRYKKLQGRMPGHWPADQKNRHEKAKYIRPKQDGQAGPMVKADGSLRADDPLSAFMQFFAEGK